MIRRKRNTVSKITTVLVCGCDMDSLDIPKHHVRLEVCATRPAYREGRKPTAVKVFTIHHESCYLLVQGVPAVGTSQELSRLFESFGSVAECRPLDDYPADKFSEVYLIKFQKIQSARFAKRKLDDYSFFGGNLHICYAPEYETVQETRHKLEDRRRVIAAKIRQHAGKPDHHPRQFPHPASLASPAATERVQQFCPTPPSQIASDVLPASDVWGRTSSMPAVPNTGIRHSQKNTAKLIDDKDYTTILSEPAGSNIGIKPAEGNSAKHVNATNNFSYSDILNHPQHKSTNTAATKSESLVIKCYSPKRKTLRFVPRQATRIQATESGRNLNAENDKEELNSAIQREAFKLREPQGPALPLSKEEREQLLGHRPFVDPNVEASVNSTVKEIRKRLSKVISESVPKKMKQNDMSAQKEQPNQQRTLS